MRNLARQLYRQKNNEAARKSRESAKQKRAQRRWVLHHPDLTTAQREDAEQFLQSNGKDVPGDALTRAIVRQHLIAGRAVARARFRRLLERLDAAEVSNPE